VVVSGAGDGAGSGVGGLWWAAASWLGCAAWLAWAHGAQHPDFLFCENLFDENHLFSRQKWILAKTHLPAQLCQVPFAERKGSAEGKVSFAESILLPPKEVISVVIVKFKSFLKKIY
jgi:hypothetical protein